MNVTFRKSMIAGAIAALFSAPLFAAGTGEYGPATDTGAQSSMQSGSGQLSSMTPQQLRDMQVFDASGQQIGEVSSVVQSRAQSDIQLVISPGGLMGGDQKKVAVPLDEVQMTGDRLMLSETRQELEARPEFSAQQYVELQPTDQPISDFAAFETEPSGSLYDTQPSPARGAPWSSDPTRIDPAEGETSGAPWIVPR